MTVKADLVLRSDSLPLVSVARELDVDELEHVHRGRLESGRQLFIAQFDDDVSISATALTGLPDVQEATSVGHADGKKIYRLTIDVGEGLQRVYDTDLDGAPIEPPTVKRDGWHETKVFKSYATLSEFQSVCEENGITVDLQSITNGLVDDDESSAYGLTDRQEEALTLALSRGYYETPRAVSAEELADELGISQPSISDLLRRAERQLLASTLGNQREIPVVS
ncbi:MAG: helix-turn-helix domain-containing protein [archaeon]